MSVQEILSREQIVSHLEEILASPAFTPSRRCQEFLRYVTLRTLDGGADSIKERTIGTAVFGKGSNYEPGEDSLVRVKASEVRRRLTRYYETSGAHSAIRLELPVGGYVPRFHQVPVPVSVAVTVTEAALAPAQRLPAQPSRQRWFALAGVAVVVLGAAAFGWVRFERAPSAFDQFWKPMFGTDEPLLIHVPVLGSSGAVDGTGNNIGMGAASGTIRLAVFCMRYNHPYVVKMGRELSFFDMRRQPTVLLGSAWALSMKEGLRFQFHSPGKNQSGILDTKTGRFWPTLGLTPERHATVDHAIVARLLGSESGKTVIVAAGITTYGTQSAVEFLVEPANLSQLIAAAPSNWASRNIEAVIETKIIGDTPGPPKLTAADFW